MHDRHDQRRDWLSNVLAGDPASVERASEDASFRSYWRVESAGRTLVLMDAPPGKEDLTGWLDINARLRSARLHAPEVLAVDQALGFVLMEDLGTRTYLPELAHESADALYADAFDALLRMQTKVDVAGLPAYDRQRLVAEMELLPEWFLKRHLGCAISGEEQGIIEAAFSFLVQAAEEQPRAFVHRDFHSRNLMIVDHPAAGDGHGMLVNPGIIDFQDAVIGPITYDLVSLLRDCYVEWEAERVAGWVEGYRLRLQSTHLLGPEFSAAQFSRWFDLIGLQRHIKVLGIFCRLWYRDGKRQYLDSLALCFRYALAVARRYPELHAFAALLERALGERDIRANRELTDP